jgi:hypothetical protein
MSTNVVGLGEKAEEAEGAEEAKGGKAEGLMR